MKFLIISSRCHYISSNNEQKNWALSVDTSVNSSYESFSEISRKMASITRTIRSVHGANMEAYIYQYNVAVYSSPSESHFWANTKVSSPECCSSRIVQIRINARIRLRKERANFPRVQRSKMNLWAHLSVIRLYFYGIHSDCTPITLRFWFETPTFGRR